jgi:hypothetical protein
MLKKTSKRSIGKRSKAATNNVREQVFSRDLNTCIVSGSRWAWLYPCGGELTIQHAVKRGMGGSALYDDPDYLRAMCAVHNFLDGGGNADFREACLRNGWSAHRWVADRFGAKVIPVWYQDGWHLLQNGGRVKISDNTADLIWSDIYEQEA